jgi:hypothetical protein
VADVTKLADEGKRAQLQEELDDLKMYEYTFEACKAGVDKNDEDNWEAMDSDEDDDDEDDDGGKATSVSKARAPIAERRLRFDVEDFDSEDSRKEMGRDNVCKSVW